MRRIFDIENTYLKKGHRTIVGVDEVGRGALAGPVTAAAVSIDFSKRGFRRHFSFLRDSKKLTATVREKWFEVLKDNPCIKWSLGFAEPALIDEINIFESVKITFRRAIIQLPIKPDLLLLDGNFTLGGLGYREEAIIGGDNKVASIIIASVMAKVARDRLMKELDEKYPYYGFSRHKGYGTKLHLERLSKSGPSAIHRKSYKPVKSCIN